MVCFGKREWWCCVGHISASCSDMRSRRTCIMGVGGTGVLAYVLLEWEVGGDRVDAFGWRIVGVGGGEF